MKVQWTEGLSASQYESISNWFPKDFNPCDFDKDYEGDVIGTNRSFCGTTYLTIACSDGKIRNVESSKVIIIRKEMK